MVQTTSYRGRLGDRLRPRSEEVSITAQCPNPPLRYGQYLTLVDYAGWDAAQQLTVAAALALLAMVVLVRPMPRLLTSTLLFVFGLLALASLPVTRRSQPRASRRTAAQGPTSAWRAVS